MRSKEKMSDSPLNFELYKKAEEMVRIGRRAVRKAQEENRAKGVPNVYSINGILYYELPNGELSREDPYEKNRANGAQTEQQTSAEKSRD